MVSSDDMQRKLRDLESVEQQRTEELQNLNQQIQQLREKFLEKQQQLVSVRHTKDTLNELVNGPSTSSS